VSTSNYERAILAHYFCFPGPWKGGSENWNQLDIDTIKRFIDRGLLIQHKEPQSIEGNHEALRVYMDALDAVPLPIQRWTIPEQPTRREAP
jgi:hypothetical protein